MGPHTRSLLTILVLLALATATAHAHPGWGIVVDSRGNVFYTDLAQVWRVEPSGRRSVAVPDVHTHELYLDAHDNLYGEHLWYVAEGERWFRRVWKLSPEGQLSEVKPATELKADWWSGKARDLSFVRAAAGNMYWAADERVVMKRAPDGRVTPVAGGAAGDADGQGASARFTRIDRMAVGPGGSLYLLDEDRLRQVTADGAVTTVARGLVEKSSTMFTAESRHALMGLWTDESGNVFVANYAGRQVKKIGPDGRVTVFLRTHFPYAPTGGVAWRGSVYVLEYVDALDRPRVRRVSPQGEITTLP